MIVIRRFLVRTRAESLFAKRETLKKRAFILKQIREFFDAEGFLEVETPVVSVYTCCEPTIEVFETLVCDDKGQKEEAFLLPSPELFLKQMLGAGYEKVYNISKCFRNGESWRSNRHNVEFSMLEWYRVDEPYEKLMDDVASLFQHMSQALDLGGRLSYQGKTYDLQKIRKISVKDCFKEYAGIDFDEVPFEALKIIAEERGYGKYETLDDAFYAIFLNEIENHLGVETFDIVYEYPYFQSALARRAPNELYAKRFEVYVGGMELANAYEELCVPKLLKEQLLAFNEQNKKIRNKTFPISEDFVESLGGMQKASGIALGLDRFVMMFCNEKSIKDAIAFPFEGKNRESA